MTLSPQLQRKYVNQCAKEKRVLSDISKTLGCHFHPFIHDITIEEFTICYVTIIVLPANLSLDVHTARVPVEVKYAENISVTDLFKLY